MAGAPVPSLSFTDAGHVLSGANSGPFFETEFATGPFAVGRNATATDVPVGGSNTILLIAGAAIVGFFILKALK